MEKSFLAVAVKLAITEAAFILSKSILKELSHWHEILCAPPDEDALFALSVKRHQK